MGSLLFAVRTLALVGIVTAVACRETKEVPPEGGGGSGESACGSDREPTILAGKGLGTDFTPYQEGDPIMPYFGSQIGMEVEISVRLTGFDPSDIESIEVLLNVDGAPIGLDSFSPLGLHCDGNESATIETPILIDVTDHPTVVSVAQLNAREAEIEVRIEGPEGTPETRLPVVIEL